MQGSMHHDRPSRALRMLHAVRAPTLYRTYEPIERPIYILIAFVKPGLDSNHRQFLSLISEMT